MGDNSTSGVGIDLDLNLEPRELPRDVALSYQALVDRLESAQTRIYERIRQLEAVTERARERESWRRQIRNFVEPVSVSVQNYVENSHVSVEMARNGDDHGGGSRWVDNVVVMERNCESTMKGKRESIQLVAKALEMDAEVKKAHKEGGNFYDCNICLEMARDPILTCCGHLFCWVCFYKLPHVDSSAKECPVCRGEVLDNNVVPIYGNGNDHPASKTKPVLKVPPRPKAQRIESVRQQRMTQGLSIPYPEILRRIRTSIGAMGDHLREIPRRESSNYNAGSQNAQITDSLHHLTNQVPRVSSEISGSLSGISTALNDAESIVDDLETYIGVRLLQIRTVQLPSADDRDLLAGNAAAAIQGENQSLNSSDIASSSRTNNVTDAAAQLESLTTGASQPELRSSSSSRRSRRPSVADTDSIRQSRRRRLT